MKFQKVNRYELNIFLLRIIYVFQALIISWNVIFVLFLNSLNLSYFEISIVFGVGTLTIILFEIPTGIITDNIGRRISLMLYSFFSGIASLIFLLSEKFELIILANVFLGISFSFFSGSTDSILFETLKKLNRKKEYVNYLSKNHFLFIVIGVLTNFVVPLIFEINNKIPFLIASFLSIFSIFICFLLKESLNKKNKKIIKNNLINNYKNQFQLSIKLIKKKSKIYSIIIFSIVFSIGVSLFGDILNQPLIKERYSYLSYGLIFAIATIIQSILVFKLNSIIKFSKKINTYLFLIGIWFVTTFLLIIENIILTIFLLGIIWTIGTFRYIFVSNKINILVKNNDSRATIHSINSMLSSVVYLIFLLIFGVILDLVSLNYSLIILSFFSTIISLGIYLFLKKNLN